MASRSVVARAKRRKVAEGRSVTSLELAAELREALSPWSGRYRVAVWSGYENRSDPLSAFDGNVYVKFAMVPRDSKVDEMHAPKALFFVVHDTSNVPSSNLLLELVRTTPWRKIVDAERYMRGDADAVVRAIVGAIADAVER